VTAPSPYEIQVATSALRSEAGVWEEESTASGNLGQKVVGLEMTGLQAGLLFAPYNSGYSQVCDLMVTVLGQAKTTMSDIGTTLRTSAATYDKEEADNVHLSQGKW
jgi:hypothetical protein